MTRFFLGDVELHERAWGTQSYSGRPKLAEVMSARIVAFWRDNRRDPGYRITLHQNSGEIQKFVTDLVLDSNTRAPTRRLARLYVEKKRIRIKGVKLIFEMEEQES
jgi:hypothetical protein